MNIIQIPEVFKSNDTIYHYTKIDTAIQHILHEGKLRLSPRMKAYDPIENIEPSFNHPLQASSDSEVVRIEQKSEPMVLELENFIREYFKRCKQLCFCKNKNKNSHVSQNFRYNQWEDFGFMKPRMWDQYGGHYQGVCLAFSINSLLDAIDVLPGKINYVDYRTLPKNMFAVDRNILSEHGLDKYKIEYKKILDKHIFKKHTDYIGENEYRLCLSSQNKYEFIEIKNSIRGIFIYKEFVKGDNLERIHRFADKYEIDVLGIDVEDSINVDSRNETKKFHDLLFNLDKPKKDVR